jgi:hypothetical protein
MDESGFDSDSAHLELDPKFGYAHSRNGIYFSENFWSVLIRNPVIRGSGSF